MEAVTAGADARHAQGTGSKTIADLLPLAVEKYAETPAQRFKVGDDWLDASYAEVGEIVHIERRNDSIWLVGEISDEVSEAIPVRVRGETVNVPAPLFWSALRSATLDYRDVELEEVSITASPARVCAAPLRFLPGPVDNRDAPSRRWHLKRGYERELLERHKPVLRFDRQYDYRWPRSAGWSTTPGTS